MCGTHSSTWKDRLVSPDRVFRKIKPGMSIFLGTGAAEPLTLFRALMASDVRTLQDLELIQLVSLGDTVSIEEKHPGKCRLKTFFAGWVASEAITTGRVDLVPARFSRIPSLIESGAIRIDAAFIRITPPDDNGFCSLGISVDVARQAMEKASVVVGEITPQMPRTLGDTFVHIDEFTFLVESGEPPMYFPRAEVDHVFDRLGGRTASLIEDGSCLSFSVGPLYEALARHLTGRKHLGIHSPLITDAVMDLVRCGAITNRRKAVFRGKCVAAYAVGTEELMNWLHMNPLVEFQGIDVVADPRRIGANDRFVMVLPARKVDLTGAVAFHSGKGNVVAGPGEALDFYTGVTFSRGGKFIFALPSRNLRGRPNIVPSIEEFPHQFGNRESLDLVVTEYGTASLTGRSTRERALALIDIAHPDDRPLLVKQAKERHILYPDQVYLAESGRLYPADLECEHLFKDSLKVKFRPIKPSDVDGMRRLFYRFSDTSVYYRYFSPVKTMPHAKMQEYANVDYRSAMSMVGLVGAPGEERLIAEARYVCPSEKPVADAAFVVDESFQGRGIASFMLNLLMRIARERGIDYFKADVLAGNAAMLKVFEKTAFPVRAVLNAGVYEFTIPVSKQADGDQRH